MLKAAYAWLSDWCSRHGFERLALRFMVMAFETRNLVRPQIVLQNSCRAQERTFRPRVVFEDVSALEELRDTQLGGWSVSNERSSNDVN